MRQSYHASLTDIGFHTLTDERAQHIAADSPMWRCELILTDRCNFNCAYCRGLRADCVGNMPLRKALQAIDCWADDGLKNIRFSGGEPLCYRHIEEVVRYARARGIKRIALSTNGSFPLGDYARLLDLGVTDFSVSLDACCAAICDEMSGTIGHFGRISENIRWLSQRTYVTVGVVVTEETLGQLKDTIRFAHALGVADIRIVPTAQWNQLLASCSDIDECLLLAHPILRYRIEHIRVGRNVRGLGTDDSDRCYLVQDDSVIAGNWHFPCVIYMREGGEPIGEVHKDMRQQRVQWSMTHSVLDDPICSAQCLDVCIDFNARCLEYIRGMQ